MINEEKQVTVLTISAGKCGNNLIVESVDEIIQTVRNEIDDLMVGDSVQLEIGLKKMPEKEFSSLPEWDGW